MSVLDRILAYKRDEVEARKRAKPMHAIEEEARAMTHAIPRAKLVVVPGTNHYTVLLGQNPKVKTALRAFLREQ